jgi:3-hydroxyisobutyrate dehydrogenase-like beta-hydroxyacid dehydrogenase
MTQSRVGVIGLGEIGGGVAVSMARRGRVPSVFDVRRDAAADLEGVPPQRRYETCTPVTAAESTQLRQHLTRE